MASEAYRACEEITKKEAKNFAYGIRLLDEPRRQALSAVYALARRIDDIGDGEAAGDEKLASLAQVRAQLLLDKPPADDPVLVAVADAAGRYGLPLGAFGDLIDGCVMDVRGTRYETMEDLVVYCRKVAGSIGRLSLAVFGDRGAEAGGRPAEQLADDLGVALQLTNILRDIREDAGRGRIYLPAADALAAGCRSDLSGPPEAMAALVRRECAVAQEWFARGLLLLALLDRRSRACVAAMAGIYRRLLERIAADPLAVTVGRVSVPTHEKLWVAGRSLAGWAP